jgi:hypothetical protein
VTGRNLALRILAESLIEWEFGIPGLLPRMLKFRLQRTLLTGTRDRQHIPRAEVGPHSYCESVPRMPTVLVQPPVCTEIRATGGRGWGGGSPSCGPGLHRNGCTEGRGGVGNNVTRSSDQRQPDRRARTLSILAIHQANLAAMSARNLLRKRQPYAAAFRLCGVERHEQVL